MDRTLSYKAATYSFLTSRNCYSVTILLKSVSCSSLNCKVLNTSALYKNNSCKNVYLFLVFSHLLLVSGCSFFQCWCLKNPKWRQCQTTNINCCVRASQGSDLPPLYCMYPLYIENKAALYIQHV